MVAIHTIQERSGPRAKQFKLHVGYADRVESIGFLGYCGDLD